MHALQFSGAYVTAVYISFLRIAWWKSLIRAFVATQVVGRALNVTWPEFSKATGELVLHLGHGGQTGAIEVVSGLRTEQCNFWDELAYPLFPRAAWVNGTTINGTNVGPRSSRRVASGNHKSLN